MPTVSVILPTFNRTGFLKTAVESVYAQTHKDWELVIADDGSAADTRAYLRSLADPAVRTLWLQHCGNPSRVRNCAIAVATGRYVAFLDSDDVWAPSKLEKQLAALEQRAQCRWSYTGIDQIDASGRQLAGKPFDRIVRPEGWIFEQLLRLEIGIAMPTVVAERDLLNEIGGFDEQQHFGEFHDLCVRLALKARVAVVHEPLCSVRTHEEHYSSDKIRDHAGWMRLYEKMAGFPIEPRLRSHCRKMRALTALKLANQQNIDEASRSARLTLRGALTFSWRYPRWWWGALKETVRSLVPRRVLGTLWRRRAPVR